MENNEKYIVKNIKGYREDIDLNDLWAEVSPNIPKRKKRRKIGFWIFGGFILGIMTISISWMTNTSTNPADLNLSNSEELKINQSEYLINKDIITSADNEPSLSGNSEIQNDVTISNFIDEVEINDVNIDFGEVVDKANKKNNTVKLIKPNQPIQLKNQAKSTSKIDGFNDGSIRLNITLPILRSGEKNVENMLSPYNIDNKKQEIRREIELSTRPLVILYGKIKSLDIKRNLRIPEIDIKMQKIEKPIAKINRWNVYFVGGGALVNRKLNTRSIELKPELDRRTAVTNVLGSWEVEAGVGFRISPKIKIMAGLNYTQIHEKANFESDYLVGFDVAANILIHKQDGSVEMETESSFDQRIRHTQEVRYNQLRLLQIPVRVTYELLSMDRFKVNIGGLTAYSVQQKYKGYTSISASEESYDLGLDRENKFRTKGSVSYGLFLEGITHISKMVDLSFHIGYKQTRKINTEIYLIDQQYNSLSFTSGLSRRF